MSINCDATTRYATIASQNHTSAGTVAIWWKPSFAILDGVNHHAIWWGSSTTAHFRIQKGSSGSLTGGWVDTSSYIVTATSGTYGYVSSEWNLTVVTWDDSTNSVEMFTTNLSGGLPVSITSRGTWTSSMSLPASFPQDLNIGARTTATTTSANGLLGHFARWNRVLTSGEITDLMTKRADVAASSGLLNYVTFESDETATVGSSPTLAGTPSFSTDQPPLWPGQPSAPSPSDGATGVALEVLLEWDAAADADDYDVFLDTVNPPVASLVTGTASTSADSGALLAGTTYYWRVDANNASGTTEGPVWSFTTEPEAGGGGGRVRRNRRTSRYNRGGRRPR